MKQNSAILRSGVRPDQLDRFIKLNRRNIAVYSVVSVDPPIFYVPRFASKIEEFTDSFQILFDYLKDRRAIFLYVHYSSVSADDAKSIVNLEERHRFEYPTFRFIHLCNDEAQLELLGNLGCEAYFCNQNALVDESIYIPLRDIQKKYDAVYDARLLRFKRHHLAAHVRSLGLIYYSAPTEDDTEYMNGLIQNFSHAHFFNHDQTGAYRKLSAPEVNDALNQCRVGLCLSSEEGAMYASVQYLLAGLPVVTTRSIGGRDVFFDDEIALTVEATAEAVADGVGGMIGRDLDPEYVRAKTLAKMKIHRDYFVDLVQSIYHQEGVARDFSGEWDNLFFNKLVRNQKHIDTIAQLEAVD
jgi:glycosyltransferase involved in cell wall biosynthesis